MSEFNWDLLPRLERWLAIKKGDPAPDFAPPNAWIDVLNGDIASAILEIRRLRGEVVLMRSMSGFKEIKPNG